MIFAVLMSLTMVLTYMPAFAFAAPDGDVDADNGSAVEEVTYDPGVVVTDIEEDLADNNELLEGYLEQQISGGNADGLRKAAKIDRGSKLTGNNKEIYNLLRPEIEKIAAGERTDATIVLPLREVVGNAYKDRYTPEDFDEVNSIVINNEFTPEAKAAMEDICSYDTNKIVGALMADLPYEMYWYYKIWGLATRDPEIMAKKDDAGEWYAYFEGEEPSKEPSITFYFSASVSGPSEYDTVGFRGEKVGDLPLTESDGTQTVRPLYKVNTAVVGTAIQNAKNVIDVNAAKTDLQKLTAYRDYICAVNEYNGPAAESPEYVYGNPWQLIWVFDGESSTNVVCEGYSKAFKYLCDGSIFTNDISCYTVNGDMNGGKHMWNILSMDDDKNYLADITNCDEGTKASDDLFLTAPEFGGSPDEGYTFISDYGRDIVYKYDERTKKISSDILALSDKNYDGTGWVKYLINYINLQPGEEYEYGKTVEALKMSNDSPRGPYQLSVTSVEKLSEKPDKNGTNVADLEEIKNENDERIGYKVKALNFGTALLKVILSDENDSYTFEIQVNVSKDKHVHSWGTWKKTEEATNDKPAVETRECSVCHEIETRYSGKSLGEVEAEKAAAAKAEAERLEWEGTLSSKIPAAKSVKTKVSKKKVTVSWKKLSRKQLKKFSKVICKKKSFKKDDGAIRKMVKKTKKSQKITLKKKGTYYVRVRNVKGSGTTKLVSKWSKPKKIKIK